MKPRNPSKPGAQYPNLCPRVSRPFILGFACSLLLSAFAGAATETTEADQLREELRLLRQDYEQRIQSIEERLQQLAPAPDPHRLTNALPSAPATPSTSSTNAPSSQPPDPSAKARDYAERQFQHGTESREYSLLYERRAFADRVEQVLKDFVDITGYFRAGYGRDDEGGPQVAFQAPGALAKYRLGNEAENYGELAFGKNFYVPGLFKVDDSAPQTDIPSGPLARLQARISIYNPYQDLLDSGDTDFGLPEIWTSVGNVVPAMPSMKFWAGSRFYRRHDIHINDFFFYNMSGTGGGVEDIELPFGKLAVAWIGAASTSGFSDLPEPDAENEAGFSKNNWDIRLYDVPLPLGKGEFGLVYANADSGEDADGNSAEDSDGLALSFLHTREGFISKDGVNKFSLQAGFGAARTFTSGFETFNRPDGAFIRPEASDSWRFRATEHFTANLSEHFSIGPALVYQFTDYKEDGGIVHWASAGVRPIWHINKYIDVAGEAGVDWVKEEASGNEGPVYKLTLAPQISLGNRFMSRPVLRAFITYAHWNDDFIGSVGGNDYANDSDGMTYGVQMEAWW